MSNINKENVYFGKLICKCQEEKQYKSETM
jgi:hypothetical protein